jgi:hypothetical protein
MATTIQPDTGIPISFQPVTLFDYMRMVGMVWKHRLDTVALGTFELRYFFVVIGPEDNVI